MAASALQRISTPRRTAYAHVIMADDAAAAPAEKRGWVSRLKAKLPWKRGARRSEERDAAQRESTLESTMAFAPEAGARFGLPDLSSDDADGGGIAQQEWKEATAVAADRSIEEDEEGEKENEVVEELEDAEDAEEENMDPILEDSDVERTVWIIDVTKEDGECESLQVLFDKSGSAIWELKTGAPIPRTGKWSLRSDRLLFTRPFFLGFIGYKETYVADPTVDATDDLKLCTKGIVRGWAYFSPALKIGDFVMTRKATNVGAQQE